MNINHNNKNKREEEKKIINGVHFQGVPKLDQKYQEQWVQSWQFFLKFFHKFQTLSIPHMPPPNTMDSLPLFLLIIIINNRNKQVEMKEEVPNKEFS